MTRGICLALNLLLLLATSPAQAHFIWVDLKPGSNGTAQAQLYFGEAPEPGEPRLIGKVAQTKAWLRGADGSANVALARADEKSAVLSADCPAQPAASLEATCDYGVYQHGGPVGVLLQYYAKHLDGDWQAQNAILGRAERLTFDIVPSLSDTQVSFQVFYQGKPAKGCEVVVIDPQGKGRELTTEADGRAHLDAVAAGRYAVRAAHIEADRAGERDGKKYAQTWHYCTLTFDARPSKSAGDEKPAAEVLRLARDGRAIWKDFPGFTADLLVYAGGEAIAGKLSIDGNGGVSLEMPKSPVADWVEEQMQTLVQHRMPDGEISDQRVTYADQDLVHPLGRKIDLGDPSLQSVYRIKDDVITEVNRSMGKLRFTISVLEIIRNPENKYLPRSFTMNFFDSASGELKTSLGYLNEWSRVGKFDLPITILEIGARQGGAGTRQIVFKNLRLSDK